MKSTARTLLLLVSSEIVHTMRAQIALSINFNNYKINSYTLVSSINEQERERRSLHRCKFAVALAKRQKMTALNEQ